VLNAEQRLYGARRDLAASRYDFFLGRLHLVAIAGRLSEDTLRAVGGELQ